MMCVSASACQLGSCVVATVRGSMHCSIIVRSVLMHCTDCTCLSQVRPTIFYIPFVIFIFCFNTGILRHGAGGVGLSVHTRMHTWYVYLQCTAALQVIVEFAYEYTY